MEPFGLSFPGRAAAEALALTPSTDRLAIDPRGPFDERARHVWLSGDNLAGLDRLRPAYAGRVDCIYIDPPYNTGNDFVYRDRFAEDAGTYLQRTGQRDEEGRRLVANPRHDGRHHSAWLSMMLPRLRLAHGLLADDGLLFASIDDHEVHHLRMLLDDVFGADCFVAQIVVVSNRGGRDYLRIATTHEYLLCYGRSPDAPVRELPRPPAPGAREDERGVYELRDLRNRNPKFTPQNRPNLHYPVFVCTDAPGEDDTFAVSLDDGPGREAVVPRNSAGAGSVWRWGRPKLAGAIVAGDAHASEVVARARKGGGFGVFEKSRKSTTKARSLWDDRAMRSEAGTRTLREVLHAAVFDHPKPVALIARCLELGMPPDGLALDFFAGSGTLVHAATQLDAADAGTRRTVSIQLDEAVPEDSAAAQAGLHTVAAIGRTRAAAVAGEAGLRCFALQPSTPGDDGERLAAPPDPDALLDRLRARYEPSTDATSNAAPDPWEHALAAGAMLDARPQRLGPSTWRFDAAEGRDHVVHLGPALDAKTVEDWALASGSRITCRAGAVDDALALALSRRHALSLY